MTCEVSQSPNPIRLGALLPVSERLRLAGGERCEYTQGAESLGPDYSPQRMQRAQGGMG